jgi:hypothetical protein
MEHPIFSSPRRLIAIAFAGLLAGIASAAAEPSPQHGGTLEFAVLVEPTPPGVVSARRVDDAAISGIDALDLRTIVFQLDWPDAAMLANFASPWNRIYNVTKLAEDPQYPKTHVLGTGPSSLSNTPRGSIGAAPAGTSISCRANLTWTASRLIS